MRVNRHGDRYADRDLQLRPECRRSTRLHGDPNRDGQLRRRAGDHTLCADGDSYLYYSVHCTGMPVDRDRHGHRDRYGHCNRHLFAEFGGRRMQADRDDDCHRDSHVLAEWGGRRVQADHVAHRHTAKGPAACRRTLRYSALLKTAGYADGAPM
jgi:hypothetical protein